MGELHFSLCFGLLFQLNIGRYWIACLKKCKYKPLAIFTAGVCWIFFLLKPVLNLSTYKLNHSLLSSCLFLLRSIHPCFLSWSPLGSYHSSLSSHHSTGPLCHSNDWIKKWSSDSISLSLSLYWTSWWVGKSCVKLKPLVSKDHLAFCDV